MWPFAENALFKSSGTICRSLLPSLLPNDLSVDKKDSNNFFSMQRVIISETVTVAHAISSKFNKHNSHVLVS